MPLFDAHCDTVSRLYKTGEGLFRNKGHFDLVRAAVFAPRAQFFALWGEDFDVLYPVFARECAQNAGHVAVCRTAGEAEMAAAQGKLAAFLAIEGAEALDCDPVRLERAHALGVRMTGITWNHANILSGSCAQEPWRGLSDAGRAYASRAGELGILVDVSHLSEPGFWDVAERGLPFVASHSNAYAVCPHRRNLTDAQFHAILRLEGFVGVNLYAPFVTMSGQAGLEELWAHMEHFLALGGGGIIGLGCDFDGCELLPDGIGDVRDMALFYEFLLRKNLQEELVSDIFYNNLMRVVEKVCAQ